MSKKDEERAVARERLIREGELYRISVLHAKHQVINALHPEALLHGAMEHALGAIQGRLGGVLGAGGAGLLSGLSFKKLMPYGLTLGSYLVRKRLVKPALVAGVAAALGAAWLLRRKPPAQ